ncbi:MAG: hypothetical protein Q9183_004558, partial [Haloplaca sp. 2 TL-2023]
MPALRASSFWRPLSIARSPLPPSSLAVQHRFYAGQSYGGGEGDPKGENPQAQGPNPSAGKEHPGPPPPNVGKGTGGGPTKKGEQGHNTQEGTSGGTSNQSGASQSSGAPQPKILGETDENDQQSDDVKAHNTDMRKRHDRASAEVDSKGETVDKSFWK